MIDEEMFAELTDFEKRLWIMCKVERRKHADVLRELDWNVKPISVTTRLVRIRNKLGVEGGPYVRKGEESPLSLLRSIVAEEAARVGIPPKVLVGGNRTFEAVRARQRAIRRARREGSFSRDTLSKFFNCDPTCISRAMRAGKRRSDA